LFHFPAEQANRASVMGAFLRPESATAAAASSGRRGSDPRRTTALEQQHLAMVAEMRNGERRNTKSSGTRSREASATLNEVPMFNKNFFFFVTDSPTYL